MSKADKHERDIFNEAVEIEAPDERAAYIQSACGDDSDLIERINALLGAHDEADFLPPHPGNEEITLPESKLLESPGTVIGRYKLLEKIGEGGMAVVYMAEQTEPIRRKVALKIIKLGMDTKSVIARFEAERQALAMMDHPNIAKVLDAGATETGRPYFVMELVTGVSITEYCDKNNLSTKERLALFIQVCNAVQHAHQKGIIHRDIKPTNVMVSRHEGKPAPKVIDFGIAKAINQKLTEKTLFTRYAHIIGTPAYMSPEQAELGDTDIDTRSDIYSLGVLLYELLTGTTPFSEEELRKAGYIEMQRVIREQQPPKPSTKLSTLGETLTDIAKYRGCTPDLLTKAIRGDLDVIVMKSLEKVRDRRYDTVSTLAMDIQRHLKNEPVLARAPGTLYLLHKFLRKHYRITVAAVIVAILSVTIIVISLMWSRDRFRFAVVEATEHQSIFAQANTLIRKNDLKGAIKSLDTIADSKYIGVEARALNEQILRDIKEQVHSCTEKIENNPADADGYLRRAQLFHCLDNTEAVLSDMRSYLSVLYPVSETDSNSRHLKDFLAGLWTGTLTNLGPNVNSSSYEWAPCISNDGLSLLFDSNRASNFQRDDLWIAKRATIFDPWNAASPIGPPVDGQYLDASPVISADSLSLYYAWRRANWDWDLCVSTRTTTEDDWGARVSLGSAVNTLAEDTRPTISADNLSLFFTSNRSGGFGFDDIYVSTRATTDHPWSEPVNLGSLINTPRSDGYPRISTDSRLLFFTSFRPGGSGSADIFVTTQATKNNEWGPPVNLGPTVNSPYKEACCCLSADGSTLFFCSERPGGYGGSDLWQISISLSTETINQENNTELNQDIIRRQ
jgi:serine/threonine protein kinase